MVASTTIPLEVLLRRMLPISATPDQRKDIDALLVTLEGKDRKRSHKHTRSGYRLLGPQGASVALPDTVFHVLERVAEVLARGDAITIVPVEKQLTTKQAADLLNVSRQYLVRLLNAGLIPCMRTGKHRRLRLDDVLDFKRKRDKERKATLSELTRLSEDFGGYDELK
jgi:excisionase family DNA binding protein